MYNYYYYCSEYVDYEALKTLLDKQKDIPEECQRAGKLLTVNISREY